MPEVVIHRTTVSSEELRTIEHLNDLVRQREVKEGGLLNRGKSFDPDKEFKRRRHYDCDACIRPLGRQCLNVVVDMQGATLVTGRPLVDRIGCVVLRYHSPHYPKNLVHWLNSQYGRRRSTEMVESEVELAEVEI